MFRRRRWFGFRRGRGSVTRGSCAGWERWGGSRRISLCGRNRVISVHRCSGRGAGGGRQRRIPISSFAARSGGG